MTVRFGVANVGRPSPLLRSQMTWTFASPIRADVDAGQTARVDGPIDGHPCLIVGDRFGRHRRPAGVPLATFRVEVRPPDRPSPVVILDEIADVVRNPE